MRKGYAVELYFDTSSSEDIATISKSIEAAGLSGFMPTSGGRPHISLAVYSDLVPSEIEPVLSSFSHEVQETRVEFEGVSTFATGGVVFLAPKPSRALRSLHSRFHSLAQDFAAELWEYYAPSAWVPHCTLDMDLPTEIIPEILRLCSTLDLPTEAYLVEAGLVEFRPVRELMSFPLRGATPTP